ncbi:hypothetical protein Q427_07430 [Halomonas sp. BC04]|nr:hypothetical protein Q427_07430 [Halomonas sp. BC04]
MTTQRSDTVAAQPRFPVREVVLFGALLVAILGVYLVMGTAYSTRMLVEAACYAILALGLTIQWGYAGQFNAGVMGFVAIGGFSAMFFSVPVNDAFWGTELPGELGRVLLYLVASIVLVIGASRLDRLGVPKKLRTVIAVILGVVLYLVVISMLRGVTSEIQSRAGFVGGLGLPAWTGWIVGGAWRAASAITSGVSAWACAAIIWPSPPWASRDHQGFPEEFRLADPRHCYRLAAALAHPGTGRTGIHPRSRDLPVGHSRHDRGDLLPAAPRLPCPLGPHDPRHPRQRGFRRGHGQGHQQASPGDLRAGLHPDGCRRRRTGLVQQACSTPRATCR